MVENSKFVFTGSGGQGVITAAIILAEAAVILENLNAVQTQIYGAAARGGATRTNVIISDTEIFYPKVNQANVLVCLTQEAYMKFSPILRPGGLLLTDPRYVRIERNTSLNEWYVYSKDGVKSTYGAIHGTQNGTFRWGLKRVSDASGNNVVTVTWASNLFGGAWAYPSQITYNGNS